MAKGPKPPDASALAQQQQQYNLQAGTSQQEMNMVDQSTPFGSLSYSQNGTNPDGTPRFAATQTYAPQVQSSIDQLLGKINTGAGSDTASTQMGLYSQYMQPLIDQQQKELDNKLHNQGIQPGAGDPTAYNNAQNLFGRNVADQRTNWLLNSLGAAQQVQNQPYQQLSSLRTGAAPGFGATPTASIQPPNYMGAAEQQYQQQSQQANALNQGLFGVGGSLLGGWARGGFGMPKFG